MASMEIDGILFNVLHEGDAANPLVVLCHALMSNMHMWDSTVAALHQAGFSTLRYDHVGHGETSEPPADQVGKLHFDDYCRHIHEMVERTTPGKSPFGFIGCSIGGVLALRYALMYPGALSKVVSCAAPGLTTLEGAEGIWGDRIAIFRNQGVDKLAEMTVARWFPEPCPPVIREVALKQNRSCTLAGYVTCAEAVLHYDYTSELGQIQDEDVMVLAGEKDTAIGPREILDDVATRIRGAKRVLMRDTGHIPPMHQAEEFERLVIPFLKQ
ncbi:uncharacterized protein HMPREF1541_06524 [Cyphellophora europaea CBS 101466]|uniref:AB hydrolase-1 domain-containing protein n=1 Tax=Cyphellophora europaea (strain CBS 101466) TaxID=1220924 RepID=W2RS04_CYPE1|nr:uncharacterized protein HMPREF1541_06524 [Cyphellophora europaea CBS 101466]ETN38489.1 hypothetical protein HMPREF1541_06524 [Cyphellophora europaea CBS 101466]